ESGVTRREHVQTPKREIVNERENGTERSTDYGIEQRLAESAFTRHGRKRFSGSSQNHLQRFDKCGEQSLGRARIPRQTGSRRECRSNGGHSCRRRWSLRRWSAGARRTRSVGREFGELRKRLPIRHSFFPA